jgi:hypothetical protein
MTRVEDGPEVRATDRRADGCRDRAGRRGQALRAIAVLAVFLAIAAIYTRPVLEQSGTAIASDRYDPVLNASILWWNATKLPFSRGWWTPPHYYPSEGTASFTENLVGLAPIATPLYWLTGDPLRTYNLVFFLTWPLSAFAAYLLVFALTRRHDAGFIAGLAFGFAPYRMTQIPHVQVLASFWLPFALLGLHGFLRDGRRAWLVLFGASWLLQSLTNGYFMLFGAVLIGLWAAYFCSKRDSRGRATAIALTWSVASLPLLPVLLKYRAVHEFFGLGRTAFEAMAYSAPFSGWLNASPHLAFWAHFLDDGPTETQLFPGVTAVAVVLLTCIWTVARALRTPLSGWQAPARRTAIALTILGTAAALVLLTVGPWSVAPLGITFRMSTVGRALLAAAAGAVVIVALTPDLRSALRRRSALLFYVAATLLIAAFCLGPVIRVADRVVLDPAPYGWLIVLPGFDGLRVPARFWMLGTLCLSVAAGLAFARLVPALVWSRRTAAAVIVAGLLVDGWIKEMPTASAPDHWTVVQPRGEANPILELPLGDLFDGAATYRGVGHRRRVVNGVSGYDPPHYGLLRRRLNLRDPDALLALTSFGPLDVIVDGWNDEDGEIERYVSSIAGAERLQREDRKVLFRLPASDPPKGPGSPPWPIVAATASHDPGGAVRAADGDRMTAWTRQPQLPDQWLIVDLGQQEEVAAVVHSLGLDVNAYPRRLGIDTSRDGEAWEAAWEGSTLRYVLEAVMRTPRYGSIALTFAPRPARFVRLRAMEIDAAAWSVAEVRVHGPS